MYREVQLALVERQAEIAARGDRVLVIVEGMDGAGKTSLIRRATRHLDPRRCRVVALPAPDAREQTTWYFQRWLAHLPAAGEIVFFDRSWYNRAALEPVHGLCSARERDAVLVAAPHLEHLLDAGGIRVIKLFLDVGRETQARRLAKRAADPLARWKTSPLDRAATARYPAMRAAYETMLSRTGSWCVIPNDEPCGRIDALRVLVTALEVRDGGDTATGDAARAAAR